MKYNEKYDRYIDNDCIIYRLNKEGKLLQVKPSVNNCGYEFICYKGHSTVLVHRLVYETFVGEIPDGMEIDHFNGNKLNNNPDNLKLCTHKENMNNLRTKNKLSESMKGNTFAKGKVRSEFGKKFKEHYGITKYEDGKLYHKELLYFRYHNRCSWE